MPPIQTETVSAQCAALLAPVLYGAVHGISPATGFPPGINTSYCMATAPPSGDFGEVLSPCFAAAQPASISLFPAHSFKRRPEMLNGFPIDPATSGSFLTEEMTR